MKKNLKTIIIIFTALLLLLSCSTKHFSHDDNVTLTIIHINDRHGRMEADPVISQIAKESRAKGENVLIFDAGDTLHGQVVAILTKGSSMVELMNAVGYNAMVTGNHEYNYGIERMLELAEMMNFPLLAANVKKYGEYIFQDYEIFDVKGQKIGVFGVVTPETPSSTDPRQVIGLEFEDPQQTALRMVQVLKVAGCEYIIALAHLGDNPISLPENRVDAIAVPGVNLIIDGHSHTLLMNGRQVGNTLIVQAGEFAKNIGVVKVTIDDEQIIQNAYIIDTDDGMKKDEMIVAKIDELNKSIEEITNQIVGYTPFFLNGERQNVRTGDTNLSNLITDSMCFIDAVDIAFISGGSIRASIPAGDITMGHVLMTMPFSNLIVTLELSGTVILEALEYGLSAYPDEVGFFMQFSGLKVLFDPNAESGNRIKDIKMHNDLAFDKSKTYTVAMLEFLAAGGDGYNMLTQGENIVYYGGDVEVFVEYLETNPNINEESDGRLMEVW